MYNRFNRLLNETDPKLKDPSYANELIRDFRTFMVPLVTPKRAKINYSYLYGEQDMQEHKDKFHNSDKVPFDFAPLAVFEKYRNILTAERDKAGIYLQLNSINPAAQAEKDKDRELLQGKSTIEGIINYVQKSTGDPEYKLFDDTDEKGQPVVSGNLKQFEEMGLDSTRPDHIAYFFKNFYRLNVEVDTEDIVNHFVKEHDMQEILRMWCDDVLAVKAVAMRTFTNAITFLPQKEYLRPDQVYWIPGKRRDGRDAAAVMSREALTITDFAQRVNYPINKDTIESLLQAANFFNGTSYDAVSFKEGENIKYSKDDYKNAAPYTDFLNMKVGLGYIEWKTINADVDKVGKNTFGNFKKFPVKPDYKEKEGSGYKKDESQYQATYKAYFLERTSSTHEIFDFGMLYDMATHGAENEYSHYSFQFYVAPGKSAVEIAIPHIKVIHDAWARFNWVLNRAKPKGTTYNYSVLAKIGSLMYKDHSAENQVTKVMEYFSKTIDDFYINDGLNDKLGGGQNPNFEKKNGFDNMLNDLYTIIEKEELSISGKLGVNAIREAYSPKEGDGYKLQMQALAQSRNATDYLDKMILSVLMNYAKHLIEIVQDMIQYKGSTARKYIQRALGERVIITLDSLKKIPLHQYGIFVESFNTDLERQEMKQQAMLAYQQKQIPYHIYLLVQRSDNYKRQAEIIAMEMDRAEKLELQEKQKDREAMVAVEKEKTDRELKKIDAEYKGRIEWQEKVNEGIMNKEEKSGENKLELNAQKMDNEPFKNRNRTNEDIRKEEEKTRIQRGMPTSISEV